MQDKDRVKKAVSEFLSHLSPGQTGDASPVRLFFITSAGIFLAEILAMAVVYDLAFLPYYQTTLIDAAIMTILVFPFLYFFSIRPLGQYIDMHRQAEQALLQKDELQQRFFNSIDIMIAYMDRDFNFIKVNDAYAGSNGDHTPEYFVGKNHFGLYPHPDNRAIFQQVVDSGEPYSVYEKPFEYPDQPERGVTYWNWSLQPVKGPHGTVEGLVLSLIDVTDKKRAQDELHRAYEELELRVMQRTEDLRLANLELQDEVAERKQAEKKLRRSEERYRSLFNSMTEGFALHEIICDRAGVPCDYRFLEINPSFERLTGLERKSTIGRTVKEVLPDIEESWIETYGNVALTGQPIHLEDYTAALGKWYEIYCYSPKRDQFAVLFFDVTERKRAAAQLQYQATLLSNVNDAIIASDAEYRLTAWNSAAETLYGWKAEEVLGKNGLEIIQTVWPGIDPDKMRRTIAETSRWRGEATQVRRDGTRFPVEVSSIVLYDEQGHVTGYVSVNRDITERKRSEEAVRQSQLDLSRAQEVGQIGSWRLDVRRDELTWSDENHRIFGIPAGTAMTYETFLSTIHPEDRDYVDRRWSAALRGEPYDIEHRIIVDGSIKWVREKAYLEFDSENVLLGGFGITQDITERKKIEKELHDARDELELRVRERTKELETANRDLINEIGERQEVERQLRVETTALESAANGVVITDRRGNIRWTNPAFLAMTGYVMEDVLGQTMNMLSSGRQDRGFYRELWETILAGKVWRGELTNRRKDGSLYIEEQTITPVTNEDGEIANFIAIKQDITERKRAEDALRLERTRLRMILDAMPDGIYIVDGDFNVEYINPVIEMEFGPVGGRKCYAYFHERSAICEWCKNPDVFNGYTARWEWYSPRTGKTYDVFDTPLTNSDGSISKLKLMHDISARKQAQAELERRNLELQVLSETESRQRQLAETLRASAQALIQSLDLDTVIRTLLKHLRALVHADTASAIFQEGEDYLGVRAVDGYEKWTDPARLLSVRIESDTNPLFQKLLSTRTSLLIPDTAEDPDWVDYPGTEPIHNRIYLPILVENRLIGVVGLGKMEVGYFTEEHVQWAEALTGQAAVAIQNAWLFEQVRAGRERLQFLSRRLVEVQESERRYIARELHDHAGQNLTSLMLGLGTVEKEAENSEFVRTRTAELKTMTDHVLEDLHRLAINLRPASLDHLGLTPALEQLIKAFRQDSHLQIKLKTVGLGEDERLPQEIETTLYRVVQEAMTNVVRHAKARHVDVVLERRGEVIVVIVEDDGKGFDFDLAGGEGHLGLLGIQERTEMLGGTLTVESKPGSGTTLFVEVPYAHPDIAR